jgi:phage gp16-like protein
MSHAQNNAIFGLQKKLAMDKETLYRIVKDLTGQESIRALSTDQKSEVIEYLKAKKGDAPLKPSHLKADTLNEIHDLLKKMDKPIDYAKGIFSRMSSRRWAEASPFQLQETLKALQQQAQREGVAP